MMDKRRGIKALRITGTETERREIAHRIVDEICDEREGVVIIRESQWNTLQALYFWAREVWLGRARRSRN